MNAAVIVFPGSNCDRDVAVALQQSMGRPPDMVWHGETSLPNADLIVLPGGFSYGDYLRSGALGAHSPVMTEVKRRAEAGTHVLGICNGFQILTEIGLLPGVLIRNRDLRFLCKDVLLRVENSDCAFSCGYEEGQVIKVPIAHHDGNYFASDDTLDRLEQEARVVFRYCDQNGTLSEICNPNGSQRNIAGILNKKRNVLGMMPHPERLADSDLGGKDGKAMFESLIAMLQ